MEETELFRIHSLLHLIFHRNRNQHGKAKWWKWLSILKRAVWSLALNLGSSHNENAQSSIESCKRYLADYIVPRCYVAFSVVVADAQFSTLGTVLLATLSHLSKATGVGKALKSRPRTKNIHGDDSLRYMGTPRKQEDTGEALSRAGETLDILRSPKTHQTPDPVLENTVLTTLRETSVAEVSGPGKKMKKMKKMKKKKKKKKNAIDDIFNGLL